MCNATTFACNCPAGTSGTSCQVLACPSNCNGNGVCLAGPAGSMQSPRCNCTLEYQGAMCDGRVCVATDCLNGGNCSIVQNAASCSCPAGFGGLSCQVVLSSPVSTTAPGGVPIGAIVGGVIGGLVAAAVLVAAIVVFQKSKTKSFTLK